MYPETVADMYEAMAATESLPLEWNLEYKEILKKEVKITSNLEKMFEAVKNDLKVKKIDE